MASEKPARAGKNGSSIGSRAGLGRVLTAALLIGSSAALRPAAATTVTNEVANSKIEVRLHVVQGTGAVTPRIAVLSGVVAEPASQIPLQIRIAPAAPQKAFLRVRGLPPTASLSEGHVIGPGSWAVPLVALPSLTLNLPAAVSGRSELIISLIAEDGTLLSEARMELVVQAAAPKKSGPPQAITPRVAPPVLSAQDREQAEKLLARGERDLEQGNVAIARQFFLRAAQAGLPRAALLLAATYDPRELARMRAVGIQPNIAEARKWYERAVELGAPEAAGRLATLGAGG
jgi:hypothetical protein